MEEKEKKEKEMLNQIIEEAEEYKLEFYRKSIVTRENNKASNREREKVSGDFKILLVFVACFSFLNKSRCGCMHVMFVIIYVCFDLFMYLMLVQIFSNFSIVQYYI